MPDINLSPVNQTVVQNQTIKQQNNEEQKNPQKIKNGRKKLVLAIAVLGAMGVAGVSIALSTKGKKVFTDLNDEVVKGVKLIKGKAIAQDGSGFSGTLKVKNKKGKFTLEYLNGEIVSSKKDGKLFKKFENIVGSSNLNKGKKIITYDKNGNLASFRENLYYDNGKIRRTVSETSAKDFFENGKLQAQEQRVLLNKLSDQTKTLGECSAIENAKIYNEQGDLIEEIIGRGFDRKVIKYNPDGSKVELEKIIYENNNLPSSLTPACELKLVPHNAKFYDLQNGEYIPTKKIETDEKGFGDILYIDSFNKSGFISSNYMIKTNEAKDAIKSVQSNGDKLFIADESGIRTYPQENQPEYNINDVINDIQKSVEQAKELRMNKADKFASMLTEFINTVSKK